MFWQLPGCFLHFIYTLQHVLTITRLFSSFYIHSPTCVDNYQVVFFILYTLSNMFWQLPGCFLPFIYTLQHVLTITRLFLHFIYTLQHVLTITRLFSSFYIHSPTCFDNYQVVFFILYTLSNMFWQLPGCFLHFIYTHQHVLTITRLFSSFHIHSPTCFDNYQVVFIIIYTLSNMCWQLPGCFLHFIYTLQHVLTITRLFSSFYIHSPTCFDNYQVVFFISYTSDKFEMSKSLNVYRHKM